MARAPAGWDFSTWRYGPNNNEPGYLTIRASGNLTVANSHERWISRRYFVTIFRLRLNPVNSPNANPHPFKSTGPIPGLTPWSAAQTLEPTGLVMSEPRMSHKSKARKVVAVSDAIWTNAYAEGNFTLAADNYIRTGTGNITIAVGGDMTLGDALSALSTIYTAGVPTTPSNPAVNFNNPAFNPNAPYNAITNPIPNPINFPTDGGNISITTQGSIIAVQTPQLITDWLWRQGGENPSTSSTQPATYTPEAWGPIFGLLAPVWMIGHTRIYYPRTAQIANRRLFVCPRDRRAGRRQHHSPGRRQYYRSFGCYSQQRLSDFGRRPSLERERSPDTGGR